jgi:uncharacterized OsmC-like protein
MPYIHFMPTVKVQREALGRYVATNEAGVQVHFGGEGRFTAVELLLAALGGCTGSDVDHVTTRRAEPESFVVEVAARKERTDEGNRLLDVTVRFEVRFADDEAGDAARAVLPGIVQASHERLCTVSRSLAVPTPVHVEVD